MPSKLFFSIPEFLKRTFRSKFILNNFWGVGSNIFQNILYSLFFIILARVYSKNEFSSYIIANTVYGIAASFSSLGLGQWFIREYLSGSDQNELVNRQFKIQLASGIFFYFISIVFSFSLYDDAVVRMLSIIIGVNIIFDNIIYVIKNLNIAKQDQKKTFLILTTEASLKFITGCFLFIDPIPLIQVSLILVLLRVISLVMFIHHATSGILNPMSMLKNKLQICQMILVVKQNWIFIIIGSVSVIYWRIGNIFVSKYLSLDHVADYEVSFKFFSIAEIIPFIISSSIFPILVKANDKGKQSLKVLYEQAFYLYALFGIFVYTFIVSYADDIIPAFFGRQYIDTAVFCKQMFLSILIFPTTLLQANVLVSMKLERTDMWLNIISLLIHLTICFYGLSHVQNLSIVTYSIFISFIVFHMMQDWILIKRGIAKNKQVLMFYFSVFVIAVLYNVIDSYSQTVYLFPIFWMTVLAAFLISVSKGILRKPTFSW